MKRDEWLVQAQQLCVGQKKRIHHGFERTAAMDIYNNADSWSCYCHRCKQGARVWKEHQHINVQRVDEARVQAVPADVIRLTNTDGYSQRQIRTFLVSKGIGPEVINEDILWYSKQANRLLLLWNGRALGRALSPNQQPKWLMFGEWASQPRAWMTQDSGTSGTLVITEDALSAHKIAYAMSMHPMGVLATLGTSVTQRTLMLILSLGIKRLLCAYDGDAAGDAGASAVRQRIRPFGIEYRRVMIPQGLDPKDLTMNEIQALIGGLLCPV